MPLPTPAPYPATGGAARSWKCETTRTTVNNINGSTSTDAQECVVTLWGADPGSMVVGVNSLPLVQFDGPQPVSAPTPLPVVEQSPQTVTLTGTTVSADAECGTLDTAPCYVADSGPSTAVMGVGFTFTVLALGALVVAAVRR